tara:strand:+ start:1702 stop:2232 length:531 start_codon:yes stop_codon:yes gene_type:complete
MKKLIILFIIPFISINSQDLLKDLKLPASKKVQKLEKKLLKKQQVIDSLKIVNEDLLAKNKLLSTTKHSKTESKKGSIIDQIVIFEDSELSDDLYLFFNNPNESDSEGAGISFRGSTISPHLSQSELMGEFEEGKHMNQKFRIIYENRENKVWEGGMDWGEWVIEEGPFLIGIEKL